jgi:peptidyl-dipeptidase A
VGTAEALVAECTELLAPLERCAYTAWWDAALDASDENQQRRTAADVAYSDALADAEMFAAVRDAAARAIADPLVARQLALLEQSFTPNQAEPGVRREIIALQSDIEGRFARHRGAIDGSEVDDNAISKILHGSDATDERRAAWEASKSVGAAVATDVRRLARLRNDAARSLGYRDHFAMALATTEYDEARMFATLDEVEAITREAFAALKRELDTCLAARYGVGIDELGPWHYDDPFFQEAPRDAGVALDEQFAASDLEELTYRTFDAMQLDVRPVLERSDLRPRPGKSQHAFCICIDRADDVRVLANVVPNAQWTETMLHEFGHAVYDRGVARELPWLTRTMHMCVTEGVAMRCGRMVHEPRWLGEIAGLDGATLDALAPGLVAAHRAQLLVFCRWVLVMIHFERGLYANPDGPHDDRWWDLVERFQLVRRPDGRSAPDWAAKIHIAAAPVYYQNYLFGELIASQLQATFGDLRGEAGTALATRLFAPGATMRWDRLVEHATGAPLSPAALGRELRRV